MNYDILIPFLSQKGKLRECYKINGILVFLTIFQQNSCSNFDRDDTKPNKLLTASLTTWDLNLYATNYFRNR